MHKIMMDNSTVIRRKTACNLCGKEVICDYGSRKKITAVRFAGKYEAN
ncbi:MAG: hypothetical protein NC320_01095 [Clostridium sp.]|nr:hypothetical protein [Clostridium sp.]